MSWFRKVKGKLVEEPEEVGRNREKWVEEVVKANNTWDWHYRQYLNGFYDEFIAKGEDKKPITYTTWHRKEQDRLKEEREKWKEMKLRRIKNSKIKLTNAERYLAHKAGLCHINHYVGDDGTHDGYERGDYKTPAEVRASVKRMRLRRDYQKLRDFDKKIRANPIHNARELYELFYAENSGYCYGDINLVYKSDNDLGRFVIAENDIEGLSDEEIEKLYILEAI